ncbi:hypothetical protein Cni_G29363 [Canna indica]|uniref:Uncharacterized protein n=1 Tax=Canna indica TaxID=4628 RepID=A0AAQ3L869_9LILI|nr:hypothetical protein Cni_G29363 [Canna indica]
MALLLPPPPSPPLWASDPHQLRRQWARGPAMGKGVVEGVELPHGMCCWISSYDPGTPYDSTLALPMLCCCTLLLGLPIQPFSTNTKFQDRILG